MPAPELAIPCSSAAYWDVMIGGLEVAVDGLDAANEPTPILRENRVLE